MVDETKPGNGYQIIIQNIPVQTHGRASVSRMTMRLYVYLILGMIICQPKKFSFCCKTFLLPDDLSFSRSIMYKYYTT